MQVYICTCPPAISMLQGTRRRQLQLLHIECAEVGGTGSRDSEISRKAHYVCVLIVVKLYVYGVLLCADGHGASEVDQFQSMRFYRKIATSCRAPDLFQRAHFACATLTFLSYYAIAYEAAVPGGRFADVIITTKIKSHSTSTCMAKILRWIKYAAANSHAQPNCVCMRSATILIQLYIIPLTRGKAMPSPCASVVCANDSMD